MALPSYVGRFEVRNEIAQGGFAVVLRAWDEELECFVALKIMPPRLAENREFQRRFLEEARLLRRIRSPNVVTVHDVGRLNDGRPYFVMDFADRGTLASRLERPSGAPEPGAQYIMALTDALADGLAAIHEAGVIHRDIKPANILFQLARRGAVDHDSATTAPTESNSSLVSVDERILISDLGIAKDLVKHTATATLVGGTPLYQAPEQSDPRAEITPAVDVYAVSAMLWHVLTGESPPAVGGIKRRLADLPEPWRALLEQGMAPAPEDRFDTIESWRIAVHETLALDSAAQQVDLPTQIETPADQTCPYKGLAAYQPEDARFFHGREALIDDIARRLQLNRVLVVGGPSGSGKSSLVRAGLIPALKAGALPGSDSWGVALFTPGRDPLAELYFQLSRLSDSGKPQVPLEDVVAHPAMARHLGDVTGAGQPLLLCIDQAEEIFTLTSAARRDKFISALAAMTDPADSLVRVVFTIRADFYGNCAQIPWLADRITGNQVLVGPMTGAELRRAIREPARPAGLHLERGLVDAIIAEAGNEAGSLPLVAHALVETWLRRTGSKMTQEGFQAAGGVAGAISQTVEAIFDNRFDSAQRDATKRLFLRLVTPGEGTPDTRRIISRSGLERDADPAVMRHVVEALTEARLLTVDDASVQIAHEALLRTWPRLRTWIEESRDELRTRLRISRAAAEWDAEGRDADLLYRGTPLLSALEWAERYPDQLGGLERDFLDASAETKARAEAVAAERKRRTRRVRRITVAVLSILALGTSMASIVAFTALREARLNEKRAESATAEAHERFAGVLGAGAVGMVDSDPLLALFLGTEAVVRAETKPPGYDARAAMLAARRALSRDGPFLAGSPVAAGDALSIAVRGDGTMVASAQRNGVIDLIDTATGRRIGASLHGHRGGVRDVDFSPDGRRLVSVGADGTVRLWTIGDGAGRGKMIGEAADVVMAVCFGPDGNIVAAGNGDGSVQLWDAVREAPLGGPLIKLALGFNAVEFSPDGRGLVASIHDGTIYGWRLPSRAPLFEPISGVHTSHLLELAISPGGDRIATASTDGTSMVLEYPSGRIVGPAFGADYQIGAVAFTPDGRILIGGNDRGGLNLWDVARHKRLGTTPSGHSQGIVDAELSEDGRLLATLGRDQVIRFWSFDSTHPLAGERQVAGQAAKGLAFSSSGQYLAAGDDSGLVQVWQEDRGRNPIVLQAHQHQVWALAFSPDGKLLASGDRSGQVRLWNMPQATQQRVFEAHDSAVWSLVFTPDGNHLITAGEGDACLWVVGTGQLKTRLAHDAGRITRAVLSPNGARLAITSTAGDIRIWDLERMAVVRDIKADDDVIWSAAFSPDSRQLAAASSDEVVTLWDLADGRQQGTYTGHTGGATDLAFLADGVTLVVVDRSGMLHWWDTRTGRRLSKAWQAHAGTSWRLAVHPDGERFATAGDDGKVKIWDELSVARACQISKRVFDDVRRRQYLGQDERSLACE